MTTAEYEAKIAELTAANKALKAAGVGKLTLRVSEKGALSVYGLGRFPVTLYAEQWARLLGESARIQDFITMNQGSFSVKA